jgi:hypothetical protein
MNKDNDYEFDICRLVKISKDKYDEYVNKINDMCLKEANKGNVQLVLTSDDLDADETGIIFKGKNIQTLKIFLENKGYCVTIDEPDMIEISWAKYVIPPSRR